MGGLKIFSIAFFSYLSLALYSNYLDRDLRGIVYQRGFVPSAVLLGLVVALVFFVAFVVGYFSKLQLPTGFLILLFLVLSFHDPPVAPILALLLVAAYYIGLNPFEKFPDVALGLSLTVPVILYAVEGVPLFHWELRYKLVGPLVLLALLGAVGMSYTNLSLRTKTLLLLIYSVVFFLGTFRSLLLLGYLPYLLGYMANSDKKSSVFALFFGALVLGLVFTISGSLTALLVRVGFTFLVFHNLVRISLPGGYFHGSLLLSDNPRHLVSELFGASTNYTYFFFGQAVADFGVLGLLEAFLLGVFLRDSEADSKTLGFVCSVMIYALDSGVDALILLFIIGALIFQRFGKPKTRGTSCVVWSWWM